MVKITEITSDDDSNGGGSGHPNKKPQEECNTHKRPKKRKLENFSTPQQEITNLLPRKKITEITSNDGSNGGCSGHPNKNLQEECNTQQRSKERKLENFSTPQQEILNLLRRLKITEITSNDGSNGGGRGHPNKKPQEECNTQQRSKKRKLENFLTPQQEIPNLLPRKNIKTQNLRMIPEDLPDDITHRILSLVDRFDYPILVCTSKGFRDIINTPRIFEKRLQIGRTEPFLYTFIRFSGGDLSSFYILHRKTNYVRLTMLGSHPPILPGSAVVTMGHQIYIIGGKLMSPVSSVYVFDCRLHTLSSLPDMRRARYHAAAGVIDGKIYVIGGCTKQDEDWVEFFDINLKTWKAVSGANPKYASSDGIFDSSVMVNEKIYLWDNAECFVYQTKQHQWIRGNISKRWAILQGLCCVVEDRLYTIDSSCSFGSPIIVHDPMKVGWNPVQHLSSSDLQNILYSKSKMTDFGGKLVILGQSRQSVYNQKTDIRCIVIALERRGNGEIWGSVESNSHVLTCLELWQIEHCVTVTV